MENPSEVSIISTVRRYGLILIVGLLGILLSLAAFVTMRELEQQRLQADFWDQASDLAVTLESDIRGDLQVVYFLGALYNATGGIDRLTFRSFAQNGLARQPGIQALEWIPVVPQEQRSDYEASARREGFPDFQFTERNAQGERVRAALRPEYYPVYFVEPLQGNEPAVGFDQGSDATRLQALRLARDSGKLTCTARVTLVQEKGQQSGFLAFVPIYRRGAAPATEAERRAQLVGYMLGVFRVGDMVDTALKGLQREGIQMALVDRSAPEQESSLYGDGARAEQSALRMVYTIEIGQRQWELLFYPTEGYLAAHRSWTSTLLLVAGLLFTALLAAYLFALQNRNAYTERLVVERTAALRESEERYRNIFDNAVVGIFQSTSEGRFLRVNPAMARMYGYASPDEMVASVNDIAHQVYVEPSQRAAFQRQLQEQGLVKNFEAENYRQDGSRIWTLSETRCVRDDRGAVQFYEGTLVDITARRRAEEALQRAHDEAQGRVAWAERRTNELVSVIMTLAAADFTQRAPVTRENDVFDTLATGLNMLSEELDAAQRALRESESRYRTLVEHIPAVTYVAAPDGTGSTIFVSPQIEAMLGYSQQEWKADPNLRVNCLHPQDRERVLAEYAQAAAHGESFHSEYRQVARNGRVVWTRDETHLVTDESGQPLFVQGILSDITERRQAEEAVRQALAKERELRELQSRFITRTAHEFRTPLTIILSSAELLEHYGHKWPEEKKLDHLHRIEAAIKRLGELVEAGMTLDQALVGQIEFQPAPLDLAGFCRDMVEEAQRSAGDRCMLTLVQHGECPPASLDIDLLRIILRNLLSNAVKFSPRGGAVQLELECVESRAILRIKDQGIGIPAADQAHLFEPFYRGHNTDDIFGVGLGLVTVKKAVDLHGGTIAVESQVRVGTTVTVTLPIQ